MPWPLLIAVLFITSASDSCSNAIPSLWFKLARFPSRMQPLLPVRDMPRLFEEASLPTREHLCERLISSPSFILRAALQSCTRHSRELCRDMLPLQSEELHLSKSRLSELSIRILRGCSSWTGRPRTEYGSSSDYQSQHCNPKLHSLRWCSRRFLRRMPSSCQIDAAVLNVAAGGVHQQHANAAVGYGQILSIDIPAGYHSQEATIFWHTDPMFSYQIRDRPAIDQIALIYVLR